MGGQATQVAGESGVSKLINRKLDRQNSNDRAFKSLWNSQSRADSDQTSVAMQPILLAGSGMGGGSSNTKHILPRPPDGDTIRRINGGIQANLTGGYSVNGMIAPYMTNHGSFAQTQLTNGGKRGLCPSTGDVKRRGSAAASFGNSVGEKINGSKGLAPFTTPQYTGCRYDIAKPPYSYASLIAQALLAAPERKLTLNQIYTWIMEKYPYYHSENSGWQNSIRHNLSLNSCFVKLAKTVNLSMGGERDSQGKGAHWTIKQDEISILNNGTFKRRKLTGLGETSKSRRRRKNEFVEDGCNSRPLSNSPFKTANGTKSVDSEYLDTKGTNVNILNGGYNNFYNDDEHVVRSKVKIDNGSMETTKGNHPTLYGEYGGNMARSITDWENDVFVDFEHIDSVLEKKNDNLTQKCNRPFTLSTMGLVYSKGSKSHNSSLGDLFGDYLAGGWSEETNIDEKIHQPNDPKVNGTFDALQAEDLASVFCPRSTRCSGTIIPHIDCVYDKENASKIIDASFTVSRTFSGRSSRLSSPAACIIASGIYELQRSSGEVHTDLTDPLDCLG